MKSTKLYFLSTFLFLIFSNSATGQDTIKLIVDTSNIRPGAHTKESCYFYGQEKGDNPEDFLSTVAVNNTAIWIGISENKSDDLISITKIKYAHGTNVFNRDSIMSARGKNFVKATVKNSTKDKEPYKYIISFKVNNRGGYRIDPLIRTNNTIIPKNNE